MQPMGEMPQTPGRIRLGAGQNPLELAAQRRLMSLSGLPGGGGLMGGGGGAGQVLPGPESGAGVGAPGGGLESLPPELLQALMSILGGGQMGGMQ